MGMEIYNKIMRVRSALVFLNEELINLTKAMKKTNHIEVFSNHLLEIRHMSEALRQNYPGDSSDFHNTWLNLARAYHRLGVAKYTLYLQTKNKQYEQKAIVNLQEAIRFYLRVRDEQYIQGRTFNNYHTDANRLLHDIQYKQPIKMKDFLKLLRNMPAYCFNSINHRWEKSKESRTVYLKKGWRINSEKIFTSKYNGLDVRKFVYHIETNSITLVEPYKFHADALGIDQQDILHRDDIVRCFYDYRHNAVGMRTPYIKGLKENNYIWDNDARNKAHKLQTRVARYLRKTDPTLKFAFNIGNEDVGKAEIMYWENIPLNKRCNSL